MRVVGVIPARFGSSRLPGKALLSLAGKPMLQWVIEGVQSCESMDELIVATDHEEIKNLAESVGCKAVMTDSHLASGTDRVWAAASHLDCDVVINIQGDEPLVTGVLLDQLVAPFFDVEGLEMSTLAHPMERSDLKDPSQVKVILNKWSDAIYFSRFPIPYSRHEEIKSSLACLKHIGLYAYSRSFLETFCSHQPVDLEQGEGLEQLRALYLGAQIRVVPVNEVCGGVDTPEDVTKIEALLKAKREDQR